MPLLVLESDRGPLRSYPDEKEQIGNLSVTQQSFRKARHSDKLQRGKSHSIFEQSFALRRVCQIVPRGSCISIYDSVERLSLWGENVHSQE